jgi:hypothetical protein
MDKNLKQKIQRNSGSVNLIHALESKWVGAEWTIVNYNYKDLKWFERNSAPKPTEEEIQIEIKKLQDEYDSLEFSRNRESEYPPIVDQLDDIYHNGISGWKNTIKAIKDKYPK